MEKSSTYDIAITGEASRKHIRSR